MTNAVTRSMQEAYVKANAKTPGFLSGLFMSSGAHFHNSEEVELDVSRTDEEIAVAIADVSAGYRMNAQSDFTSKTFRPPAYKEAIPLSSFDLLRRNAGDNPFKDPDFRANLITRAYSSISLVEQKIRRAVELQASQVLQTGKLVLTDANGVALYSLDYKPKATHFATVATSWATATGKQKRDDLDAMGEVIRDDGLGDPDRIIMGTAAYEALINDPVTLALLDVRNYDVGRIVSAQMRGNGGTYRGVLEIGKYKYDLWTYGGRFINPQTQAKQKFIDPGKIIMQVSDARLNASFGAIPNIGKILGAANQNLLPELPGRISNTSGSMDLFTNTWISQDGDNLFLGVGARPLLQPTDIDSFGCIDTQL